MNLNLIYGRAGSGKSTYIFEIIKNIIKGSQKIFIITPEQFSFTAEKKLLEIVENGAVINAEVLTFSRMAYRVINENGNQLRNIESFGKSMLIYDILDSMKQNLNFLGKSLQNVEVIENSIREFKMHNVTSQKLLNITETMDDKYLQAKLLDIRSYI